MYIATRPNSYCYVCWIKHTAKRLRSPRSGIPSSVNLYLLSFFFSFSPDGEFLYSHGVGGQVYIWDLKAQQCVHKFVDDGCNKGTALAVSRNNR